MKQFLKSRPILVTIACIGIIFLGISHGMVRAGQKNPITDGVQTMFLPLQRLASRGGNHVRDFVTVLKEDISYQEQNRRLQDEIETLKREIWETETIRQENQRLRELMEFTKTVNKWETVGCDVIGKNAGNWFYTFTVDKGTNHGVNPGDIATENGALIGKVTESGADFSVVTTIIQPNQAVGAMIANTQEPFIAEGDATLSLSGKLRLVPISTSGSFSVGDVVHTSGIGGVYPQGLMIGTISETCKDVKDNTDYAIVDTDVDFRKIRQLLILKMER